MHNNSFVNPALTLGLVLFANAAPAEQMCKYDNLAATAPASRFQINNDATITDLANALVWKRCSEGQTWDGSTCAGTAALYSWQEALQLAEAKNLIGNEEWRLPNIKELASLVEKACENPAIDNSVFPNTPSSEFWSSSPYAADALEAWFVGFYYGEVNHSSYRGDKAAGRYVRLVRSNAQ